MKQPETALFRTGSHTRIEALLKIMDKQFVVEESDGKTEKLVYYDTFDWRLYRKQLIFCQCGNRLLLQEFNGRIVTEAAGRYRKKYFWWDFNDSGLQEILKDSLEMRALSPIVSLASSINEFRIMNRERKTIARLGLRSDSIDGAGPLSETVIVDEVRGYDGEYRKILQGCSELGLKRVGRKSDTERILKKSGRVPGGYGDKFSITLDGSGSIGEAVSRICLKLVEDMETNRDGIVADIDSEFLHDFRIAVRRTRSLISLLKKILPEEMTRYYGDEFKWLGTVTGPVRDIDVYLLEKSSYISMLPESLRSGLELFFDELRETRVTELKLLQSHLKSPRYEKLIEDWRRFLEPRESPLFSGAMSVNSRDCADAMIVKRLKNFIRDGNAITDSSPDEELHRLRIKGKKFRYLLEFFKCFYDDSKMDIFLKQMKKLQNNLGDFNDLSVQQGLLNGKLDSLRGKNLQTLRLAAALGGLVAVLSRRHEAVRGEFGATYAHFANAHVRTMIKKMVNEKPGDQSKQRDQG